MKTSYYIKTFLSSCNTTLLDSKSKKDKIVDIQFITAMLDLMAIGYEKEYKDLGCNYHFADGSWLEFSMDILTAHLN